MLNTDCMVRLGSVGLTLSDIMKELGAYLGKLRSSIPTHVSNLGVVYLVLCFTSIPVYDT